MSGPPWLRFEWDDANIDYIARHNYTPDEVEEVFAASPSSENSPTLDTGLTDRRPRMYDRGHIRTASRNE